LICNARNGKFEIRAHHEIIQGTPWRWKVAGSILDGVIRIFH